MKKVLFIIPSLVGGGAEKVLVVILQNLDRAKYRPMLVVLESEGVYSKDIPADVLITYLGKKGKVDNIRIAILLARTFRKLSPDIICSFMFYTNLLTILSLGLSGLRVPVLFTEHSNLSIDIKTASYQFIKRSMGKMLYPRANRIICVSRGVKDDLVSNWRVSPANIDVIYNPIKIETIHELMMEKVVHPWYEKEMAVLIACGRLTPQKNYPLLLRAFADVSKIVSNARLVIMGDGELKGPLLELTKELGLSDSVDFIGYKKNPFSYIGKSKILILSSSWEGFGNVLVESMACGTPVISTRCPSGPDEIITNGVNGILVPMDNEAALSDAIIGLLNNKKLRSELAEAGKQRADDFDTSIIMKQYEQAFDSLL